MDCLDVTSKIATVLIAVFNLYFSYKLFSMKNDKDDLTEEKKRRLHLFQVVVLDYDLKHLYDFFDEVDSVSKRLLNRNQDLVLKREVIDLLSDEFILFRRKFVDVLFAIDVSLHKKILSLADDLQSHLSTSILDSGINLSYKPKFDEVICEKIVSVKIAIIKELYNF
jgi:hypothetical protein